VEQKCGGRFFGGHHFFDALISFWNNKRKKRNPA